MAFLRVLRLPHLAILWVSQVLSAMGDYFYDIAVMWLAVQSAGSMAGIVAATEAGAFLVFGLLGGVYADRWNRRSVMIAVDCLRACIVGILPVLAICGLLQFWMLIVAAALVGSLGALFDPALQASLPVLAGDVRTLQATNGLMDVTRRLARVLGPSLAGVLIIVLPLPHFFTLDAVSFGISALAVLSLGKRFSWQPATRQQVQTGVRGIYSEIVGAIQQVQRHKLLNWGLVMTGLINLLWSTAFIVGVPLFASRVLNGSIGAYGLIVGAYGVGNVISNLVIGSIVVRHRMVMMFTGKMLVGLGFILMVSTHSLPVALLGSALAALGGPMGDIVIITMIQTEVASDQVGKVYSLRMVLEVMGSSLGLLLAVPLFAYLNVQRAILLCSLLMVALGAVGLMRFGFTEPEIVLAKSE